MKTIGEFLKYINNGESTIVKVYKYNNKLDRNTMVKINVDSISDENKNGDIYYVVNSGSDKNDGITKFNAVFIDFDAGKNKNDEYYTLEEVKNYKASIINKLKLYNTEPTFIIETRNGYHVYWALEESATVEKWQLCTNKLISKFNSDKQVNNPARLMRLPFTYWMKNKSNPFYVDIVSFKDTKYNVDHLLDSLSDVEINDGEKCGGNKRSNNKYLYTTTTKTHDNKFLIQSGDIIGLRKVLNTDKIVFNNQNEFYNYITQEINLSEFLGVSGHSFKCIFHEDKNPSAGIFISKKGQYVCKCHSSSCGFFGNIIRCVERLRGCNRPKTIEFIKEVYQLEIMETDWQKQQKYILEENKRMIRDGELEEYYPEVYKLIKNYTDLIFLLHDIAIDNVYDEKYSDNDNNVVFFASISRMMDLLNYKNSKRMTDRIAVFAFLEMLNKLSEDNIPEKYLEKAKKLAKQNNQKYIVNFYSIPSYCDELLGKSLDRVSMFKDNNLSMRGWGRELLQRTFGDEFTNEVYPQLKGKKITQRSQDRTLDIHNIVMELLEEKGYALEKEVVEILRGKYGKEKTEVQIKRSLQEMLDTYDLNRVRCNKKIKEHYGIVNNGFPFIIVRKEVSYEIKSN